MCVLFYTFYIRKQSQIVHVNFTVYICFGKIYEGVLVLLPSFKKSRIYECSLLKHEMKKIHSFTVNPLFCFVSTRS
jgi:hypothetical protein